MKQHFKTDAERIALIKRTRRSVSIVLIIVSLSLAYMAWKIFIK